MSTPVKHDVFRERPLQLCSQLLGMELCQRDEITGAVRRLPLIEVEAYMGFQDRASHAHRGKTPRNAVMFGEGGVWYVYLCYGVHWLLNLTVGPADYPAAILIRGAGPIQGPGRLTRYLGIDQWWNGMAADKKSGLWLEPGSSPVKKNAIVRTPRIGIDSAGSPWKEKPWRFLWTEAPGWPPGKLK